MDAKEKKLAAYHAARPLRTFVCEGCGKTVETRERRKRRFCSSQCKNFVHNREWAATNPERVRAYRRSPARMAANRQRSLSYYAANRDRLRAEMRSLAYASRVNTPWKSLLMGAKSRAKQKGLEFDLTDEWAQQRWTGRCEISGISFQIGLPKNSARTFWPSIDRIDPKSGYTQSNCRFILHAINALKGGSSDDDIVVISSAIINNNKLKMQRP